MSTHTPGPWTIDQDPDGTPYTLHTSPVYQACIIANDAAITDIRLSDFRDKRTPEEARANAQLIAAAPDLLAACEAAEICFRHWELSPAEQNAVDQLRVAIAKATGGEA